jgi:uncharacterized RDD family membrane protein YckC
MFCSQCGTRNADEAKFCQNCGAPLMTTTPPVASTAPPVVHYAGFWRRFVAYCVDRLILFIPDAILTAIFGLQVFSLFNIGSGGVDFDYGQIGALIASAIWLGILSFLIQLLYYALFESSRLRATPGKMALGIVVTDLEGRQVSFGRALGRNLGKILSSLILCIGYIMAGLTAKKQALHDMMADCLVVMK